MERKRGTGRSNTKDIKRVRVETYRVRRGAGSLLGLAVTRGEGPIFHPPGLQKSEEPRPGGESHYSRRRRLEPELMINEAELS